MNVCLVIALGAACVAGASRTGSDGGTGGRGGTVAAGAAVARQQVAPHADIAGHWQYDAQASSTPQSQEGAQPDSGSRRGNRGFGGRGSGGMGGFRGRGEGGERGGEQGGGPPEGDNAKQRTAMRETMRLAMDAARDLEIQQTDSTVMLSRPEPGDSLFLHTDGRKVKEQPQDEPAVETSTFWAGGQFFVLRIVDGGGKVTEIYCREPNDPHLYVVVRVEGGRLQHKIEFRRVYAPVPKSSS